MDASNQTVCLAQRSANRDGSAISGLMTAEALLASGFEVLVAFGHSGPMIEDYAKKGCRTTVIPHGDWLRPGGFMRSVRRQWRERRIAGQVARYLKSQAVDLVYCNSLVSHSFALAAKRLGLPCVWHVRELFSDVGGEMTIPSAGGKRIVRRQLDRLSHQVIVNSESVLENICGDSIRQRPRVIYNAVRDSFRKSLTAHTSESTRMLDIPKECCVIGIPSTLRPMKGQEFFVNSIPAIHQAIPDAFFLFLGKIETEYGQRILRLIDELQLQHQVRFLGEISRMDQFYDACDVVCIPSVAEPFGRVAIEAFFARKPVVASHVGGLSEIIDHGNTGWLFEYGDTVSLVECLLEVRRDAQATRSIVQDAFQDANNRFTESIYKKQVLEVVREAGARSGKDEGIRS